MIGLSRKEIRIRPNPGCHEEDVFWGIDRNLRNDLFHPFGDDAIASGAEMKIAPVPMTSKGHVGKRRFFVQWAGFLIKHEFLLLYFGVGRRQPGDGHPRG